MLSLPTADGAPFASSHAMAGQPYLLEQLNLKQQHLLLTLGLIMLLLLLAQLSFGLADEQPEPDRL